MHRRNFLLGTGATLAVPGGAAAQAPAPPSFGHEDVVRRAGELAALPFAPPRDELPAPFAGLDYDGWRALRFRPERALLGPGTPWRMQLFHLGFLYRHPVTVNLVREGQALPVPYSPGLFDRGKLESDARPPVNLGFAGLRLHYPLNDPRVLDEVIAFLGASYFRVLGRGQRYGLSARGLALGTASPEGEEFPAFREFWVEEPAPGRVTVHALLDGPSVTGAYRFTVYPGTRTTVDVTATLFPRRALARVGLAPLTSMFFIGENDRRFADEFRPEVHDSDGLMLHTGAGEWLWRPLRNPREVTVSSFTDSGLRGFGLMQRDRAFEHYQDLEVHYDLRPGYWIEPTTPWGEGRVDLTELPTGDEAADNIVAAFTPAAPLEPGRPHVFGYRLTSLLDASDLHPGGKAVNTWATQARALGAPERAPPGTRRFLVDFAGGDLPYWRDAPERVEIVATAAGGTVPRTFLVPNPHTGGFRAGLDVTGEPGRTIELRAFLRADGRALTETWSYPWRAE